MRHLRNQSGTELSLAEFLSTQPYIVIFYTWGLDMNTFTLKNLVEGTNKTKVGYPTSSSAEKQTAKDNSQYQRSWAPS